MRLPGVVGLSNAAGRGTRADRLCPSFIMDPNGPANFIRQIYPLPRFKLPLSCKLVGRFCSFNSLAMGNKKGRGPAGIWEGETGWAGGKIAQKHGLRGRFSGDNA